MNRFPETLELESFNLLPASYRYRQRVRDLRRSWTTLITLLLIAASGSACVSIHRLNHRRERNMQLAMTALPLQDLRTNVLQLQRANERRAEYCRLIESAQPDDSALQSLAAIVMSLQDLKREVVIDEVEINLPVELVNAPAVPVKGEDGETADQPHAWSKPSLTIRARTLAATSAAQWVSRFEQSDRIEEASMTTKSTENDDRISSLQTSPPSMIPVLVTASPVATGVLP